MTVASQCVHIMMLLPNIVHDSDSHSAIAYQVRAEGQAPA